MPNILRSIFICLLTTLSLHAHLHTVGYSAWWSTNNAGYLNGVFVSQARYLDEICYFGEFRFDSEGNIHTANGGNILTKNSGTFEWNTANARVANFQTVYQKVKAVSATTRVTFTIGGWGNSQNFATFSDTNDPTGTKATHAANQIRTILDLAGSHVHGVDLDWEDGSGSDDTMAGNESSYTNLTAAIRNVLLPTETLTVAIQSNRYSSGLAVINNIDVLRPFTYDAPDGTGNHTSLASTQTIITNWLNQGIPAEKLGLGSGFYGRPLASPWSKSDTYASLDSTSKENTGNWLSDSATTYLGWGFDGPDSIEAKATWANNTGLHTFFAWELGQDTRSADTDDSGKSHYLVLTRALTEASTDPNAIVITTLDINHTTQDLTFTWNSQMGERYQIQWSSNLKPDQWSYLGEVIAAADGNEMTHIITDPALATSSRRFWRMQIYRD